MNDKFLLVLLKQGYAFFGFDPRRKLTNDQANKIREFVWNRIKGLEKKMRYDSKQPKRMTGKLRVRR